MKFLYCAQRNVAVTVSLCGHVCLKCALTLDILFEQKFIQYYVSQTTAKEQCARPLTRKLLPVENTNYLLVVITHLSYYQC